MNPRFIPTKEQAEIMVTPLVEAKNLLQQNQHAGMNIKNLFNSLNNVKHYLQCAQNHPIYTIKEAYEQFIDAEKQYFDIANEEDLPKSANEFNLCVEQKNVHKKLKEYENISRLDANIPMYETSTTRRKKSLKKLAEKATEVTVLFYSMHKENDSFVENQLEKYPRLKNAVNNILNENYKILLDPINAYQNDLINQTDGHKLRLNDPEKMESALKATDRTMENLKFNIPVEKKATFFKTSIKNTLISLGTVHEGNKKMDIQLISEDKSLLAVRVIEGILAVASRFPIARLEPIGALMDGLKKRMRIFNLFSSDKGRIVSHAKNRVEKNLKIEKYNLRRP